MASLISRRPAIGSRLNGRLAVWEKPRRDHQVILRDSRGSWLKLLSVKGGKFLRHLYYALKRNMGTCICIELIELPVYNPILKEPAAQRQDNIGRSGRDKNQYGLSLCRFLACFFSAARLVPLETCM